MKIFIYLLLCLSVVTSNVYARRVGKNFDLLQDANREMFKIPKFTANMAWGKSGVAIDELITYLHNHDPKVYRLYDSERGLRIQLGKAIKEEMQGDVFSLYIKEDGKLVGKYFRGEAPDLKAVIADIIATDALSAKMQWGKEGLNMDDIIAEVITHHSEVRELYVGFSHNNTEHGLRIALGKVLDGEMKGDVFSLQFKEDGKKVSKYFRGTAPDLKAIIADIVARDALSAKMQWGEEGLSMDDIMTEVSTHHPKVRELYVGASHNNTENGLRSSLGEVLEKEMQGDVFRLHINVDGKNVSKYFRGTAPDLKAIIADIVARDALSAKMQWGEEGLSMDDIMAEVSTHHPKVRELYVGASHNNNEYGLRTALGEVLDAEMQGDVFRLHINVDGKNVRKYFRGTAPDLKAIIADIVATDALSAKMQWGKEGLSMDDIMAEVITHHSEVRELYMGASHNNTEHGLRIALGMVLSSIDRVVLHDQRYFWKGKK